MIAESEEYRRIEDNLTTIRHYIKIKFPRYTLTEDSVPSLYHQFTVTLSYLSEALDVKMHKSYGLKVNWSRLIDPRNTPEHTRSLLNRGLVASWMVRAGDTYYSW